ncbi:glutamate--tRNA ligase [Enterovirga sp. DB1703]|uniref:Glutamate--tRNA ligase n=2 Tax=Enterovirga aerilata TaxID=2730920 RepID=A0A849I4M2_9HYPH|nr:glutamate--tRNA ligase [Enterovirga sp. DB1703]
MAPVLRFAPSPTGLIHIGNARTALLNALVARREGGIFVLRFDDTDAERSRTEYAEQTEADLAWLGIRPNLVVRQSERMELYAEASERLKAAGRLYSCYETAEELDRRRRIQLARGQPPIYDRAALSLTDEDRRALEEQGRRPHWRFRLEPRVAGWEDRVRGPSHVDCASLSDPVLVREDGTYLYTLPSVVDDIALGITDVVRGEDHVTNTGVQIQLFEALGARPPAFGHHNLLTTMSGEGLSKRSGALSLRQLAEDGYEPLAVAALAVLVGSSEAVRPVADLDELASLVDLAHISRGPAKFDESELDALNARFVHAMPYETARPRLEDLHIGGGEEFWNAVRANLSRFGDALRWWGIVEGPVSPQIEDPALIAAALRLLPPEPWDATTWKSWTDAVRAETGLKGRALFLPLRLALTGLDHGPELAALLPLIGPERAKARLAGEVA